MSAMLLFIAIMALTRNEQPVTTIALELAGQQPIDHQTHHVQGLAISADHFWISSVDRRAKRGFVFRVDRTSGKVIGQRELAFEAQFHPGGIDLAGGSLWVPIAEYRPRSTTTIVELDAQTLATRSAFTVGDHIGCLALTPQGQIVAANWDARTFYRFDTQGKKLAETPNPRPAAYQDLKFLGDDLVGCGTEKTPGQPPLPVVDRLDTGTFHLLTRWQPRGTLRTGGENFCAEGCAVFKGELFLMPEDGPHTTIYRFPLPVAR